MSLDTFRIDDFERLSNGVRLMHAPTVSEIIQVNTYEKRECNVLLRVEKFDSTIQVTREDGVFIQAEIGAYRLRDENPDLVEDIKSIVPVFVDPVEVVEFIRQNDGWAANVEVSPPVHPNRARRLAMIIGESAIKKPTLTKA
ncbi:MAG TPA: hypothetical protein PK543_01095 [Candidatus Saccharibacteria bacterium]|nr:hypothetical protein [Candidatus Saccharibacteria bacterium]